jgi:hypothetical protein
MKKILFGGLTMLSIAMVSCSKDDNNTTTPKGAGVLSGTISANRTLSADTVYTLSGYVYVPAGVTLTIQPGTLIKGDVAVTASLIIERGGKINAAGTAEKPIVFTSGRPAGSRAAGDWGGIFICGKGITNQGTDVAGEGGIQRSYGGNDNTDNSGVLKYVRIEYAGLVASANSEVNALSLGAVGSGTQIDHIQIWYPKDDGVECWGGAVNLKYVAIFGTSDDDLDFDFGYVGKIQYAYIVKDPAVADQADQSNGIECDNENTPQSPMPYTRPVLSNITLCGPNVSTADSHHNYAMRWRRDCQFAVYNSVFAGWLKAGFSMESELVATGYKNGTSVLKNSLIQAISSPVLVDAAAKAVIDSAAIVTKLGTDGNTLVGAGATQSWLGASAFSLTAPNAVPATGSAALTGAAFSGDDLNIFFDKVTFRGAFGTENWMAGWTSFTAHTNEYK